MPHINLHSNTRIVVIGIDGATFKTDLKSSLCCPPTICELNLCDLVCNFIEYLPKGPLWDTAKEKAKANNYAINCEAIPINPDDTCATITDHAVYVAKKLYYLLQTALQPAITESNPITAYTTRKEWLERFNWVNCFESACRDPRLGAITPYEVMAPIQCEDDWSLNQMAGNIGHKFGPVNVRHLMQFGKPLEDALEHATLVALARAQMGIIPNIDTINFVIAPLGAAITSISEVLPYVEQCITLDDCNQMQGNVPCVRYRPKLNINLCRISDTIPSAPMPDCPDYGPKPPDTIPAFFEWPVCEIPGIERTKVWPGVLAAQCIVMSLLPYGLNYQITRCEG